MQDLWMGGGGALDPPLVYCLGWICTVGKLALPIPPPPPPPPTFEASLLPVCIAHIFETSGWNNITFGSQGDIGIIHSFSDFDLGMPRAVNLKGIWLRRVESVTFRS